MTKLWRRDNRLLMADGKLCTDCCVSEESASSLSSMSSSSSSSSIIDAEDSTTIHPPPPPPPPGTCKVMKDDVCPERVRVNIAGVKIGLDLQCIGLPLPEPNAFHVIDVDEHACDAMNDVYDLPFIGRQQAGDINDGHWSWDGECAACWHGEFSKAFKCKTGLWYGPALTVFAIKHDNLYQMMGYETILLAFIYFNSDETGPRTSWSHPYYFVQPYTTEFIDPAYVAGTSMTRAGGAMYCDMSQSTLKIVDFIS